MSKSIAAAGVAVLILLAFAATGSAQTGTITGVVTNASTAQPLAGVSVRWCTGNSSAPVCAAAMTNAQGAYSLVVPAGTHYGYTSNAAQVINQIYGGIECPLSSCNGQAALLSSRLVFRRDRRWFTLPVTEPFLDVTGVPPGRYFLRVRGTNAFGTGPASEEIVLTVHGDGSGSPTAILSLTAWMSGRRLNMTWSDPNTGERPNRLRRRGRLVRRRTGQLTCRASPNGGRQPGLSLSPVYFPSSGHHQN